MKGLLSRFPIAASLLAYFWQERLWWMIPMVLLLLVLGGLFVVTQSSAIAPLIYTMF